MALRIPAVMFRCAFAQFASGRGVRWGTAAALVLAALAANAQQPVDPSQIAPGQVTPGQVATANPGAVAGDRSASPIAIVPIDNSGSVTGALQVTAGKAIIATTGTITSGTKTTEVVLPHRGVLRVCASTSVKLAADSSVPAGEAPGLMMALDHGAIETSFATGRNSDVLLTPDFRILIGAPGAAELKVRLGQHGDTCVDNPGTNAPYVLVTSVFDGGAYRVQPGQRVMFQHGSLQEVVDQEKEPCGCPPEARPGTNDFPLAQSAGLAPLPPAAPSPEVKQPGTGAALSEPLVYQPPAAEQASAIPTEPVKTDATPQTAASPVPEKTPATKKAGFFRRVGSFFKRIFGAE